MHSPSIGVSIRNQVDDFIELQPFGATHEHVVTLKLGLRQGMWKPTYQPAFSRDCTVVPGVLGILKLNKCAVLAVIREAKEVAVIHDFPVFRICKTEVITPTVIPQEDQLLVKLLKKAVDPQRFGRGLYFSYALPLTQTMERMTGAFLPTSSRVEALWKLEDKRFFWNAYLLQPLIQLELHDLVLPVMQGFVSQLQDLEFNTLSGQEKADFTLIARRSVERLGTRNWRRGVDAQGAVANFVETEQLISFSSGRKCSFVQIRGSIPVLWTNIPNVCYKAPTKLSSQMDFVHAFNTHITELLKYYKGCVGVNLAHATGSEGKLTMAYDVEARRFSRMKSGFELIHFDFHKECGTTRYHNLSILMGKLQTSFNRFSQFQMHGKKVTSVQQGVIRTNCIDCLDRTNVVQGVIGKKALESFLMEAQIMRQNETLHQAFPEIEAKIKILWADHGDEISLQYAGTGALKSGFTRTGKRSMGGLLDDGWKSMTRYYLNNFEDGEKQDALDLVSGTFVIGRHEVRPNLQRSPDLLLFLTTFLLLYAFAQILNGLQSGAVLKIVVCLSLAFMVRRFVMLPNGSNLTCIPCLRPDLPKLW